MLKKHVAAPTTRAALEATRAALVGCSAVDGRGSKVCKCSCGLMDKVLPPKEEIVGSSPISSMPRAHTVWVPA